MTHDYLDIEFKKLYLLYIYSLIINHQNFSSY